MATVLFIGPRNHLDLVSKLATQHAVRHVSDEGLALNHVYNNGWSEDMLRKFGQSRYDLILYDSKAFFDKANPTEAGRIFSDEFLGYLERVANVPVVVLGGEPKAMRVIVGPNYNINQLMAIINFSLN